MPLTPSTMLDLGTPMPSFCLPDLHGTAISSDQFPDAPGILIAFICPHCPFVQHIRKGLALFGKDYQAKGLAVIGINANDIAVSPHDDASGMKEETTAAGYAFPYLIDETQEVAKAFRAACTPDFFLFDRERKLAYRGQFDGSRPGNNIPVTGADLRAAADAVLSGRSSLPGQTPSIGCNIKWKSGGEPHYLP